MTDQRPNPTRRSTTRWVPLAEMRVSDQAQRSFSQSQADGLAANLDLDALGYPVVSHRDGVYWIVDGQHRVSAYEAVFGEDAEMECEVYENLTEEQEAKLFLDRDSRRAVNSFDKFRIGLVAGRPEETRISAVLDELGLCVSRSRNENGVLAVESLRKVYALGGQVTLRRTMETLRDSFGEHGYGAAYIHGLGLVIHRYQDRLDQEQLLTRLKGLRGGPSALNHKARQLQAQVGLSIPLCYAAAFVDVYNRGSGGRKVTPFLKAGDRVVEG